MKTCYSEGCHLETLNLYMVSLFILGLKQKYKKIVCVLNTKVAK